MTSSSFASVFCLDFFGSLFVPPVFLGEFLYLVLNSKIRKRIFSAEIICIGMPCSKSLR